MRINTIFESSNDISLESYLNTLGVLNHKEFLKPKGRYIEDPLLYDNIQHGINIFREIEEYFREKADEQQQ